MPSSNWEDRRFMFPVGREVYQGSRRYSASSAKKSDEAPELVAPPTDISIPQSSESGQSKTFAFAPYAGDRRFMFPAAKEVHVPSRRQSGPTNNTKPDEAKSSLLTPPPATVPSSEERGVPDPKAGRRRSSASSQGAMLGGLLATRSSEEHKQRRQSWEDMKVPGGLGGFLSNLVNKSTDKKE